MATASYPELTHWPTVAYGHRGIADSRPAGRPLAPLRVAWTSVLIIALLLLNKIGDWGSIGFFAILGVMVLRSPRHAFQALAICALGLMINKAFVPKTAAWTVGRLMLPAFAMIRFTLDYLTMRNVGRGLIVYGALLAYICAMAVCSIMSGWYTHIALLKLFNFWISMTAIWLGMTVLRARRIDLSEWFVALITAACAFGVLAIITGAANNFQRGDLHVDSAFVGAFSHPNCHALYASLFITFLSSVGLYSHYRYRWLVVPLIGLWLLFMAWSASRTSFVAVIPALLVLAAYASPVRSRSGRRLRSTLSRGVLLGGVVMGVLGLVVVDLTSGGMISQRVIAFVNKSEKLDTLEAAAILRSRQGLIDHGWTNFLENPVFGIGFQVATTEAFVRTATLFTAPAEKGFLPTAVLEEGGVFGASFFVIFLGTLVTSLIRERNVPGLAVFAAMLAANLTEVSLFAPGGMGLFGWTMVGAAIMLGDHCWVTPSFRRPTVRPVPA